METESLAVTIRHKILEVTTEGEALHSTEISEIEIKTKETLDSNLTIRISTDLTISADQTSEEEECKGISMVKINQEISKAQGHKVISKDQDLTEALQKANN